MGETLHCCCMVAMKWRNGSIFDEEIILLQRKMALLNMIWNEVEVVMLHHKSVVSMV